MDMCCDICLFRAVGSNTKCPMIAGILGKVKTLSEKYLWAVIAVIHKPLLVFYMSVIFLMLFAGASQKGNADHRSSSSSFEGL